MMPVVWEEEAWVLVPGETINKRMWTEVPGPRKGLLLLSHSQLKDAN